MIPSAPVWFDAPLPRYPRAPRGTLRADVAVIGGGFAGLSAAYHLLARRPGARVVVLEARRLGAGASGRTTGLVGPGVGQSLRALVGRHGPARARALYAATLDAVQDVQRLVARERIDCQLDMTGQLVVALSRSARSRLAAEARLLAALDLPVETLDDTQLDARIRLRRSAVGAAGPAALRLPIAGTLHPTRLVAGLAERVTERGGEIFELSRVTSIRTGRSRSAPGSRRTPGSPGTVERVGVTGAFEVPVVVHRAISGPPMSVSVRLDGGGEVVADVVVVATAGYTPDLGLLRGRVLPVHLQVIATERLDAETRDAIGWKAREGVIDARRVFSYFRLTGDDRIVFGGGAPRYHWGGTTDDDPAGDGALDQLASELPRIFGAERRIRVAGGWTGVIGYVLDTLPAIQRMRERPAVLHAVGWCGHGVALSIASGAWVAQILCDGATPNDLPWFRDRLPLLPSEAARWVAFQLGVRAMSWLDRVG